MTLSIAALRNDFAKMIFEHLEYVMSIDSEGEGEHSALIWVDDTPFVGPDDPEPAPREVAIRMTLTVVKSAEVTVDQSA